MAQLKDSLITGDLRVTGTIYGDANLGSLNASGTGLGTNGQILTSTGVGLVWANPNISGNAATATTLQTPRKINGTSFNGSADITTVTWGTARNISISDSDGTNTGTAVSVNGGAAATLKLPATIKASLTGNASTATKFASNQSVTLTGDTTGTVSSQAGWSVATTTSKLTLNPQITTATDLDAFVEVAKIKAASISTGVTYSDGTLTGNDGEVVSISYSTANYANQIFFDPDTDKISIRRKAGSWKPWIDLLHTGNYSTYAATKSHTHGNITNDGKIGTTANKGVYTGTGGALTAGTIPVAAGGTGAESFVADAILTGNDSNAINSSSTYVRGEMLETGRYFHNVAQYYTTATPKEILIKTKLKFSNGSRMPKIIIHMYNYADNNPTELSLGFYIYGDAFTNYGATSNTSTRPVITLSTYTENGTKYVAIGLGLIGTAIYPNGYFTRFNIDVLDIWSGSTAKTAALEGWVITDNTTTSTIIPTDDRKVVDYKDQSNSAKGFASAKTIALTGNVTGSATGGNGSNGWSIATTIGSGVVTNAMLAGSIANGKLVNSKVTIAGNDVSLGGSLAAATLKTSLGLNSAMHYIGKATVAITDGSTTDPKIGGNATTLVSGDVIIDSSDSREYIWNGSAWELLGGDSSYKVTQTAVTDAAYSGSDTATTFVSAVTQNANGEITVTKRKLPTYNNYSHPTGDGNKHVPANGTSNNGKFLQATATAGTYQWASLPTASTTGAGIIQIGTAATNAAAGNHTHTFASLTSKPTTLSGYGITDGLGWQVTTSKSTELYDFGFYVNRNNAAGTGPAGSNYFSIFNLPYSNAAGNSKAYWGWQLGGNTDNNSRLWFRTTGDNVFGSWQEIAHAPQGSSNIGSATQPVYMTSAGVITAGTALKALAYKDSLTASDVGAAAASHTHNYAGSSSAGGAANSLANFKVTTSASLWAVDSPTTNAIGYQGGLTKAAWNYQQTDGAIYDQFYSSSWIHQIFGDYRTGQISVRGKNNGTWQAWRRVLDETNASTILGLGTLATKSTISAHSYTPAGTITLTNGNTTTTVSAASSGATTYTPGGSVSQPTFTGSSLTSTGNFTPAGSVSVSTNATTNKTATVSAASSGDTTYTPGGTNSAPAFTGTAATIVVNGGTGTATYTPAGTIAVNGTTSTATVIKTATFNTVVTSATVANEILTISTGASGSSTNQTGVRIADPAYKFTGTGTRLTASYTPAGSVAAPTFTGTAVRLVTGNIAVPNTYTATFTGTQGSVSVSGTPAGTVSKPTFSGTAVRLVTGNISRPTSATFSGTPATLTHSIS